VIFFGTSFRHDISIGSFSMISLVCYSDREKWKASRTGVGVSVGKAPGNATLIARFCRNRGGPASGTRACEHALLKPKARPCTPTESFLSTGDTVTLELRLADSTSLK
jgi:hypothetical protein